MERQSELEFSVGKINCVLLAIQPENCAARRIGKYYEHRHPCFEIHYIECGETTYSFSERQVRVCAGQLLMIPPRTYHKETYCTADSRKMSLAIEIVEPEGAVDTADMHFYKSFSLERESLIFVNNSWLKSKLLEIKSLAMACGDGYLKREKMRAGAHALTVALYEQLSKKDEPAADLVSDSPLSRELQIDTFLALNFMSQSSKSDLAKSLHVSERQLHRIVKKSYGKNYREKLSETRLEIAMSFLGNSDKSISEISELLGYSSVANFSSFIKRETGKTPSEIRRGIGRGDRK